jgi:CoA:oxalate CoA-transferase
LASEIEAVLAEHPAAEWLDTLGAAGVPCAPVNDVAAVVEDAQVVFRRMVVTLAGGAIPGLRTAGNPIKVRGVADPVVRRGAPDLDGDRAAIVGQLEATAKRRDDPAGSRPTRHHLKKDKGNA